MKKWIRWILITFCAFEYEKMTVDLVRYELLPAMAELETYYASHKFLLSVLGLWPYNRSPFSFIRRIAFFLLILFFLIPQCLLFTTTEITPTFVLKILSPITVALGALLKYTVFWYQTDVTRMFLDQMRHDLKDFNGKELEIVDHHAHLGGLFGKIFAVFIYPSAFGLIILDIGNFISYIFVPRNDTYTYHYPFEMDYLVDGRKYYLFIVTQRSLSLLTTATSFVATEMTTTMLLQYSVSLFNITRYRILNTITQDSLNAHENNEILAKTSMETLVAAVVIHRRAMKFAKTFINENITGYGILIILGVVSLSANLYRLSQTLFNVDNFEDTITSILFIGSEMGYMFYLNYIVQQMTDCTENLVPSMYNANWYQTSLTTQKSLLLFMLRCTEEYSFTFLGLYSASIQGFSVLVQKSVSGLMIMTSLQ